MTLAEKLKELRTQHGYKQVDIASVLGIVRQSYSHYEKGDRTPNTETLYMIAAFYGITINDLLKDTIELDPELFYNSPGNEINEEDSVTNKKKQNIIQKKALNLSASEQDLIVNFKKSGPDEQKIILDIAKLFAKRSTRK